VNVLKGVLEKIGLDPGRVKIVWCAASEGEIFAKDLRDFIFELKAIGPIGTELKNKDNERGKVGKKEIDAGTREEAGTVIEAKAENVAGTTGREPAP
jgi:heterodisulfide reductase subunit A